MDTQVVKSFCRSCQANCGVLLTIDENDHILNVRGDPEHPMSAGYICFKGVQAKEAHRSPARLKHSMKRMPDGSFAPIPFEQALDEIAEKMQQIIQRDGPTAIATYKGNGSVFNMAATRLLLPWLQAIGSPNNFTSTTIDQPEKLVTPQRLGLWGAGKQPLDQSDVVMMVGGNPLVSHAALGFLVSDPTKTLKKEKARGLRLIVIDPRFTETARHADVFLQPYPGEDPTILAGLLHIILKNGWEDKAFCTSHVETGGVEKLRQAVAPFTPDYVAHRSGVAQDKLLAAAKLFAHQSHKGSAFNTTGVSMSPRGTLSDHLMECINVVCGRLARAGDQYSNITTWEAAGPRYAEVMTLGRRWEKLPPSRIRGAYVLFGERMSGTLAEEILTPGEGQIKCLMTMGGNPAISFPDQNKTVKALKSLELLVTIEPYMTATAKLAHYILAPKMQYERPDVPSSFPGFVVFAEPWGQYTNPVVKPPAGSNVVDEWYILWGLAKRLGVTINFSGVPLDMQTAPASDDLLAIIAHNAPIPFEDLKKHPGGKMFNKELGPHYVQPGRPESAGRFDVIPDDIAQELATVAGESVEHGNYRSNGNTFSHRLAVRRILNVFNSITQDLETTRQQHPYNPAFINPDDLAALGLASGDKVEIVSGHGHIPAIVKSDSTIRPGVVSISHGFGGLPGEKNRDYEQGGACTNQLTSTDQYVDPVTSMPRMSAIPVNIVRAGSQTSFAQ